MLLRFSVTNHLSIRDTQELSLVATSLKDRTDGLIEVQAINKVKAVPAAIIFGPNASGKSNLLLSMGFMREQVLRSHRDGGPETTIGRQPFALSERCKSEPTVVEADFIVDDVRYTYGFAASDVEFEREWLYSYPHGTRRKLFERTSATEVEFGGRLKGRLSTILEFMRPNSLYLSVAIQNKHEQLSKLFDFFYKIDFSRNISISANDLKPISDSKDLDYRSVQFIKACGTGVNSFREFAEPLDESSLDFRKKFTTFMADNALIPDDAEREDFMNFMLEDRQTVQLSHLNDRGLDEYFEITRESAGTRRLLHLLRGCFRAIDSGTLMIIDEIDASLHTQVCEAIVYLFHDRSINVNGAQLLATTHDTNLLRSIYLRRDQVWLTEKDANGSTELFSLADIKTRSNDNFELGYLQGRYGAVPFTGPISDVFSAH